MVTYYYEREMNAIEEFNTKSGFRIIMPLDNKDLTMILNQSKDDIQEMTRASERYEAVRARGYSDDHLASEIGSFVLNLNQRILSLGSS
jgi:hypothetical protein